jgi:hypothetical protein
MRKDKRIPPKEKIPWMLRQLALGRSIGLDLVTDKNDYRLILRLEKGGYLERHPMTVLRTVKILLLRLTENGVKMCQSFGWEVGESEWTRISHLHKIYGGSEKHTAAILWFAYQARRRKWVVNILPKMNNSRCKPDLVVKKNGQTVFVEVQIRPHGKVEKWATDGRYAAQEDAVLGICTLTPSRRKILIREAASANTIGMGTDLQSLSHLPDESLLWLEDWKGSRN